MCFYIELSEGGSTNYEAGLRKAFAMADLSVSSNYDAGTFRMCSVQNVFCCYKTNSMPQREHILYLRENTFYISERTHSVQNVFCCYKTSSLIE